MSDKMKVILDCDTGSDDAVAIMMAILSPKIDLLGVSTVAGNKEIGFTTDNTLRVVDMLRSSTPVYRGCATSMVAKLLPNRHGDYTGMTGVKADKLDEKGEVISYHHDCLPMPAPVSREQPEHGVWWLIDTLMKSEGDITLIPTGPLTNVAGLLLAHPELKPKIAQISLMGGGVKMGNWTPAAEFNILVDPEAARLVFQSGIPILMAGLDVTEKALVCPEDFGRIRAVGNPVAVTVADWLEFFYQFHKTMDYPGAPIHDAVAVAALVKPEILTVREMYVDVEVSGDYCMGCTVGDWHGTSGHKPNTRVLLDIDREAFVDLLVEAVKTYGEVR